MSKYCLQILFQLVIYSKVCTYYNKYALPYLQTYYVNIT